MRCKRLDFVNSMERAVMQKGTDERNAFVVFDMGCRFLAKRLAFEVLPMEYVSITCSSDCTRTYVCYASRYDCRRHSSTDGDCIEHHDELLIWRPAVPPGRDGMTLGEIAWHLLAGG